MINNQNKESVVLKKIGLGTVQWGTTYGVSNSSGRTRSPEVANILSAAREIELSLIDTASLYGEAEKVLGNQNLDGFRIVTKTPKFARFPITQSDAEELIRVFEISLRLLKTDRVYALLLHHANNVLVPGGEYLVEALHSLKARGLIQRVGVSIYDSDDLELLYERLKPEIVQLPLNVLDQRLINDGSLEYLKSKGVEIHVRSVFLQGLLLMSANQIPAYFTPWKSTLNTWRSTCIEQEFTPLQAALNFVVNLDAIDYCILGFESSTQLQQCVNTLRDSKVFKAHDLACSNLNLINPVNWRLS